MADEIDQANDIAQSERDRALAALRDLPMLPATGQCYNCGENLHGDLRWCDSDCRDDWEKRQ